jgi:hypothetical protein
MPGAIAHNTASSPVVRRAQTNPVQLAAYHGASADNAMNESVARMAIHGATPGADAKSLSRRDRLALLVLMSLKGGRHISAQ